MRKQFFEHFMIRIVIFASGSGTNAENLINYFNDCAFATVVRVLSNNEHAKVLQRAKRLKIKTKTFSKSDLMSENTVVDLLKEEADFIVLAGFLWRIPLAVIEAFPNRIVNIHPALLPKYGGKGMYGMHVHRAVIENREKESGITIHFVNEHYDEGAIIFQDTVAIDKEDSAADLAVKIHQLEYAHYPQVIEQVIRKEFAIDD